MVVVHLVNTASEIKLRNADLLHVAKPCHVIISLYPDSALSVAFFRILLKGIDEIDSELLCFILFKQLIMNFTLLISPNVKYKIWIISYTLKRFKTVEAYTCNLHFRTKEESDKPFFQFVIFIPGFL